MRQMGSGKDGCPELSSMGQCAPFAKGGAVKHTPPAQGGTVPPILGGTGLSTPIQRGANLHTPPAPGRVLRGVRPVKKYPKECYLIYIRLSLFLGFIWFSQSEVIFIFENG